MYHMIASTALHRAASPCIARYQYLHMYRPPPNSSSTSTFGLKLVSRRVCPSFLIAFSSVLLSANSMRRLSQTSIDYRIRTDRNDLATPATHPSTSTSTAGNPSHLLPLFKTRRPISSPRSRYKTSLSARARSRNRPNIGLGRVD